MTAHITDLRDAKLKALSAKLDALEVMAKSLGNVIAETRQELEQLRAEKR